MQFSMPKKPSLLKNNDLNLIFKNPWEGVSKVSIFALVFLMPLFFSLSTLNPLDTNKQFLMLFLVFVSLAAFVIGNLISKEFSLKFNPLNLPVLVFLAVYALATLFSISPYKSFWGYSLNISSSFLAVLFFVFLYFLIINVFIEKKDILKMFFLLAISTGLVAIFNLFQMFNLFIFPWDFTQNAAFNTIGSPNAIAIFFAVLLPLFLVMIFDATKKRKWLLISGIALLLLNLFLINFKMAWLVLSLEMFVLFLVGIVVQGDKIIGQKNKLISFSGIILVLSLVFFVMGDGLSALTQLPPEVSLSQGVGLSIAKESLLRSPILGTGPGTFTYDYLMFKPQEINQSIFWDAGFEKGASVMLDRVMAIGVLGILSFLFMLGMFLYLSISFLKEKIISQKDQDFFMFLGVFTAFLGLAFAQFIYSANFTLEMLFWALMAGLVGYIGFQDRKIKISAGEMKKQDLYLIICLALSLMLSFVLFLSALPKYSAEIKYSSGIKHFNQNNLELATKYVEDATKINPYMDLYHRDLAMLYLTRLNIELTTDGADEISAGNFVFLSTTAAENAVKADRKSAMNWALRGLVYQNLIGVSQGAPDLAIESYRKAMELEPLNPSFVKNIGRIYMLKADFTEQESEKLSNLKLAKENLEKSILLKGDFLEAKFLLSAVLLREGDTAGAILKLEELKRLAPGDADLAFQLGIIYYNNDQTEMAITELKRTLSLVENFLDAKYFLGLSYDKIGRRQDAISEFEGILGFEPDNQEIQTILSNLRGGRPALDGIAEPSSPEILNGGIE